MSQVEAIMAGQSHWQHYLSKAYKEQKYVDMALVCDEICMFVHRLVICAHSEIIEALIQNMVLDEEGMLRVSLSGLGIPSRILKSLVESMYTGDLELSSEDKELAKEVVEKLGIVPDILKKKELQTDVMLGDLTLLAAKKEVKTKCNTNGNKVSLVKKEIVDNNDDTEITDYNLHLSETIENVEEPGLSDKDGVESESFDKSDDSDNADDHDDHDDDDDSDELDYSNDDDESMDHIVIKTEDKISPRKKRTGFHCEKCQGVFNSRQALRAHLDTDHSSKPPFLCLVCKKKFKTEFLLIKHVKGHKQEDVEPVIKTEKIDTKKPAKNSKDPNPGYRKMKKGKKNIYGCNHCKVKYFRISSVEAHIAKEHPIGNNIVCGICDIKFDQLSDLQVHNMDAHYKNSKYECEKCNLKFTREKLFLNHIEYHTGNKKFACNLCGKSFNNKSDLTKHNDSECDILEGNDGNHYPKVQIKHPRIKSYVCDECGKQFSRQHNLIEHMNYHIGVRPYSCDRCPKTFARKTLLHQHITRVHQAINKQQCSICHKILKNIHGLKSHIRNNHGTMPFQCVICEKSFRLNSQLQEHHNLHTGATPFKCEECPKSFPRKVYLCQHKAEYHNASPLICPVCGRVFRSARSLKSHEVVHNTTERYMCMSCNLTFKRESSVHTHKCKAEEAENGDSDGEDQDQDDQGIALPDVNEDSLPATVFVQNEIDEIAIQNDENMEVTDQNIEDSQQHLEPIIIYTME